jgi:hypothetical protein
MGIRHVPHPCLGGEETPGWAGPIIHLRKYFYKLTRCDAPEPYRYQAICGSDRASRQYAARAHYTAVWPISITFGGSFMPITARRQRRASPFTLNESGVIRWTQCEGQPLHFLSPSKGASADSSTDFDAAVNQSQHQYCLVTWAMDTRDTAALVD